ncbi:DUF6279 family lipoprotein [Granulosicoccus sp.]|nr:DUF6279 family lipoprotein [Granulosicoccus sp.]MDB4223466.1 DUF6279 family lipoprotein [Granulosicoccus sp.]
MIPIDALSWDGSRRSRQSNCQVDASVSLQLLSNLMVKTRLLKLMTLTVLAVLLTGCTNSKLIIGPLYNRLDDQMRTEFNKLGDFNEVQNSAFEQAVGTFHVWHRQVDMPKYADLLQEVADSIAISGTTERDDVARWATKVEDFSRNVRECHPVNFLFDLTRSLTDQQINFIENRFKSERKKNRERYATQTRQERVDRRLKNIVKWSGRLGLDFSTAQQDILREGLSEQVSLRKEYYALSDEWNSNLFVLARDQDNPDYHDALANHMTKLWSLLEDAHPEEWQANRDMWREKIHTLIGTFSKEQSSSSSRWLKKMGRTIRSISNDKPSFNIGSDPAVGCLVATNN